MTIGFNEWRLSDDWSCDERHRDCLLPEVSSQRTPGPCWEQLSADLIEISQRKHGLRPCQVLGQAAVSHFGEAPQLLDCMSSEPFGQVSNRFKRGSGPSELKLWLRVHDAAGVVARWFSA